MADDINDFIQRAVVVARSLLAQGIDLATQGGDAVSGQVQEAAEDLIEDTKASKDALVTLVRSEIDRAVGRLGLVREDELAALRRHVERLEGQIAQLRSAQEAAEQAAMAAAAKKTAARASATTSAKDPAAKKTPAKTAAKKPAAKAPVTKAAPARSRPAATGSAAGRGRG